MSEGQSETDASSQTEVVVRICNKCSGRGRRFLSTCEACDGCGLWYTNLEPTPLPALPIEWLRQLLRGTDLYLLCMLFVAIYGFFLMFLADANGSSGSNFPLPTPRAVGIFLGIAWLARTAVEIWAVFCVTAPEPNTRYGPGYPDIRLLARSSAIVAPAGLSIAVAVHFIGSPIAVLSALLVVAVGVANFAKYASVFFFFQAYANRMRRYALASRTVLLFLAVLLFLGLCLPLFAVAPASIAFLTEIFGASLLVYGIILLLRYRNAFCEEINRSEVYGCRSTVESDRVGG